MTLSPRQLQIADLVSAGLGNAEIAQRLGLSEHTVRAHLREMYARTGCDSRVQLAVDFAMGRIRQTTVRTGR
jgi:DNA-binding CsgD family transcriptional regulator